jgi:hypothetical protein
LDSFQEMDWPYQLDDPLPPKAELVPQRRLKDTVRNLNCGQKYTPRVLFSVVKSGTAISWRIDCGRNETVE